MDAAYTRTFTVSLRGDEMYPRKADEGKVMVLTQDSRPEKNDIVCLILQVRYRS